MHPASLAAMFVLGINDHVLKQLAPGVVTGKLSDVAGLFFFPFLLALIVSPVTALSNTIRSRSIGASTFVATGVVFVAIKIHEGANRSLAVLASALLDTQIAFMIDPLDILAVTAMIPAWKLWLRCETCAEEPIARPVAIPAVIVAALLSMATSKRDVGVVDLAVAGNRVAALTVPYHDIYSTTDQGKTWHTMTIDSLAVSMRDSLWQSRYALRPIVELRALIDSLSAFGGRLDDSLRGLAFDTTPSARSSIAALRHTVDSVNSREAAVRLVLTNAIITAARWPRERTERDTIHAVDPRRWSVRYRSVRGSTRIDRSDDGGRSWTIDWEIPEGRYEYVNRQIGIPSEYGYGVLDMVVAPDGNGEVLASRGGAGVLVRDREGNWSALAIDVASPVPSSAKSFDDALMAIDSELTLLTAAGVLAMFVIYGLAWTRMPQRSGAEATQPSQRYRLLICCIVVLLNLCALVGRHLGFFAIALPTAIAVGAVATWDSMRLRKIAKGDRVLLTVIRTGCVALAMSFALPFAAMYLWAVGTIVEYHAAARVAVGAWAVPFVLGVFLMLKHDANVERQEDT